MGTILSITPFGRGGAGPGVCLRPSPPSFIAQPLSYITSGTNRVSSLVALTVTTITHIFKGKGPKDTESNYRGISVAGVLAKLYGAVISARLTWYLETNNNNLRAWSQAGGRPELGVLQHHFALQHFRDLYRAPTNQGGKGVPLFVCLIDFEKAFDRVDREIIWLRLEERGIHGKLLETIKAMYSKVRQKVRINGRLGEGF